jgi:D-glycerate 3-kinase
LKRQVSAWHDAIQGSEPITAAILSDKQSQVMSYGLSMQASLWPSDDQVLAASDYQRLAAAIRPRFIDLMRQQALPLALLEPLCRVYLPLAAWVNRERKQHKTFVLGINGAQGAGKSTLTSFLQLLLQEVFGLRVAAFSIDDIYFTHQQREKLAHDVHPLLATRGVPGTHDVELGIATLDQLCSIGERTSVPAFDKGADDRAPESEWKSIVSPVDVVIMEGWCVGAKPQAESALLLPLNELEEREDSDGFWRRYVNEQLTGAYARLFAKLNRLVMLRVPDMRCVYEWRSTQEDKLAASDARRTMDSSGLKRFIMHYERLTRHMLAELPERADVVLYLDEQHQFTSIHINH